MPRFFENSACTVRAKQERQGCHRIQIEKYITITNLLTNLMIFKGTKQQLPLPPSQLSTVVQRQPQPFLSLTVAPFIFTHGVAVVNPLIKIAIGANFATFCSAASSLLFHRLSPLNARNPPETRRVSVNNTCEARAIGDGKGENHSESGPHRTTTTPRSRHIVVP